MQTPTAYVNKIIDLSVVDGPGNRTAIFLQGCNFDCFYCHNPETIRRCIHCGACVDVCPAGALSLKPPSPLPPKNSSGIEDPAPTKTDPSPLPSKVIWREDRCIHCDACLKACTHLSSPKVTKMTAEDILQRLLENRPFIQGITTSGGECTLQHQFLAALFAQTRRLGLTNFVDTNGGLDLEQLPHLVDVTDQFMLDLKASDPKNHLLITKKDNAAVLKNARYLASIQKLYELRTVVLAGMDNEKTLEDAALLLGDFLPHQPVRYKLIAYRPFGVREEFAHFQAPSREEMEQLTKIAQEKGFQNVMVV